jgi:hypothetical protein
MILVILLVFAIGIVVGSCINFASKTSTETWQEREQRQLTYSRLNRSDYSPMQDTSPDMYNEWGVHKHNPMLDR